MPSRIRIVPLVLLLAATCVASGQDTRPVQGVVVDAKQKPVAGVKVAAFWSFRHGVPEASEEMVTDDEGRFRGEVSSYYGRLIAYTPDLERAGVGSILPDEPEHDIEVMLMPSVRVSGTVTCSEMKKTPGWFNSYWTTGDSRAISCSSKDGVFEVVLPRHDFTYYFYDKWFTAHEGELKLLDGKLKNEAVDLGAIDLPAHFLAKHVGKELPKWNVTDARGVNVDAAQLSDFRGKWVLLEFWGYW